MYASTAQLSLKDLIVSAKEMQETPKKRVEFGSQRSGDSSRNQPQLESVQIAELVKPDAEKLDKMNLNSRSQVAQE